MNREGLFWIGVVRETPKWAYINKEGTTNTAEDKIVDGLTFDEAEALIKSMGYEFVDGGSYWERYRRVL